jgi:hypothetical protein
VPLRIPQYLSHNFSADTQVIPLMLYDANKRVSSTKSDF